MHDDEDVLHGVFDLRVADPERAEDSPHERGVLRVDVIERRHGRIRIAFEGMGNRRHLSHTCGEHPGSVTRHGSPSSRPRAQRAASGEDV